MFNVAEFWPNPAIGQLVCFIYDGPVALQSNFATALNGDLHCADYQNGVWKDTWLMRRDPVRGVIEYGDDLETTNSYEKFLIGPVKKIRYKTGKEIIWGHYQNVGDLIHGQIEIDHSKSLMLPPVTTADSFGYQTVGFESLYDDMLTLVYAQPWGDKVYGARYHMKHGVGPVQIEWRKPDGTFTNSIQATVKVI